MLEIDIAKASSNQPQAKPSSYLSDDTDVSEVDTAVNTPLTDRRFSTTSSNFSFKCGKKPSITPKLYDEVIPILEKRLQCMEQQLNEHIKRELDLESQLLQQKKDTCYKTTLDRINKRIDQFFQSKHNHTRKSNPINFNINDCYNWLVGNELPALHKDEFMQFSCDTVVHGETNNDEGSNHMLSFNKIFIHRLKSILKSHQSHESLYEQFYTVLNAWESQEDERQLEIDEQHTRNDERVTRLLEALNKSLLKNKILRKDSNLIIKKHQSDLKKILKEQDKHKQQITRSIHQHHEKQQKRVSESNQEKYVSHHECESRLLNLKTTLNSQIKNLDKALLECQEERDEYETTVEMVRREMETMLEELEDTRQQKLRFKTQASRLRTGLEALQKKKKSSRTRDQEIDISSEDESEDEAKEAIRLMYNEAERQAMDLDRECKRQALTLSSVRKELKLTEEKYHSVKTLKNKQVHQLEQTNRDLARKVNLLQIEKQNLSSLLKEKVELSNSKSDTSSMLTAVEDDDEQQSMYQAKIYTLQIALKAAKSDASIQRYKIFQLERQASLLDFTQSISQLQDTFRAEPTWHSNDIVNKAVADKIEYEQNLWKLKCEKSVQKKYDIDLLRVNRELRFLSGRIVELEDETEALHENHKEELKRVNFQVKEEANKRLQKMISSQALKEQRLQSELDVVYQTNQTLQDEILVLCGRNLKMADQLRRSLI